MAQTSVDTQQQPELDKYGNPKEYKKMKLEEVRKYHAGLIADLGISPIDFNMKMPFYDKIGRYVVGIFRSEFKREKGFFFEMIDRDLNPLEEDRKVYRIAPNDNFEEEYDQIEYDLFLVPVDELRVINPSSVAVSKDGILSNDKLFSNGSSKPTPTAVKQESVFSTKNQPINEPKPVIAPPKQVKPQLPEDAPYNEMTIRDYIAIHTGKPVSNKPWLNQLLTQDLNF